MDWMELERDFARRRLERKLKWTQDMMLCTLLGLLGFLLGLVSYVIGGFGILLLCVAFYFRLAAYEERDNPDRSSKMHFYRFTIAAFGCGAVLGSIAKGLIEMFSVIQ